MCHYAVSFMFSVADKTIVVSVFLPSDIKMSVVILNVVAPQSMTYARKAPLLKAFISKIEFNLICPYCSQTLLPCFSNTFRQKLIKQMPLG
jgi:hypothetical protein